LLPALPGRNVTASSSVVLSHHTPLGPEYVGVAHEDLLVKASGKTR
jgi:hypothetical protein